MALNRQKQIEQFAKLAATILGRCPHEFGLVPDADGFIKIKEFMQALGETEGWRHIRISHLNDMMLMISEPPVEMDQGRVRAKDRFQLPPRIPCEDLPKLLYVCIRQKSYPSALTDGIRPSFHDRVVCCKDAEMAKRIGKRRDPNPVLLTVHVEAVKKQGVQIDQAGEGLYLADGIPSDCFTGPPLPKEAPEAKRSEKKPDPVEVYKRQTQGGSFTLDLFSAPAPTGKAPKGKHGEKNSSWKYNKKRLRKEKRQYWSEE